MQFTEGRLLLQECAMGLRKLISKLGDCGIGSI